MGFIGRAGMVVAVALAAASCTSGTYSVTLLQNCVEDPGKHLRGINWLEAEKIDVRIRDGELAPLTLRLSQGKPYVIRIQNRDDWTRRVHGEGFFEAIVVSRSAVGKNESKEPCISMVVVAPGETVEIEFVAVRDGRYPIEARSALRAPLFPGPGHGVVTIR